MKLLGFRAHNMMYALAGMSESDFYFLLAVVDEGWRRAAAYAKWTKALQEYNHDSTRDFIMLQD